MPKISSKYKNSDMSPNIAKFKERDYEGMIKQDLQGQLTYKGNEVYIYAKIHGAVEIAKHSERKPLYSVDPES